MNSNIIRIGNTDILYKEYKGQRVVTLKDIDMVHDRPDGTARRNFNTNKKHLIKDEDYFVRNSHEAKVEFDIIAPNGLVLMTEQGYLMLAKSFTDDLAWDAQRQLVNKYFRNEEKIDKTKLSPQMQMFYAIADGQALQQQTQELTVSDERILAYNRGIILGVFRHELEAYSTLEIYERLSARGKDIVMKTLCGEAHYA